MAAFMKYAVETDSGAMLYIRSFTKTDSGIQKLMGGGGVHRDTDSRGTAKACLFSKIRRVS
jgi:hypothetical protein